MKPKITIFLLAAAALLAFAAPAQAEFGFKDLAIEFEEQGGAPATQAGSHPYAMTTTLDMNTVLNAASEEVPDQDLRELKVELPPGFVGDPDAAPTCPTEAFNTLQQGGYNDCPDASSIGVIAVRLEPGPFVREFPVFNLEPIPGEAARIGFVGFNLPVTMGLQVAEGEPHEVISSLFNVPQSAPFYGADLTLWGNPADPSHDPERGGCLDRGLGTPPPRTNCSVSIEPRAFLTLPRNCTQPQVTSFRAHPWQVEGLEAVGTLEEPPLEGCEELEFGPEVQSAPETTRASSPSGLDFAIDVEDPGLTDPKGRAASDIKAAKVTLPAGVEINPAQAEGLQACTQAEFARERSGTTLGAGCPSGSKIGSVEVETPLLEGRVLRGDVFVATPHDNPFGTLIALYMTIKDPERGVNVGLAGKVTPIESGPEAGRIEASFDNLPQLPFSHFRFHFRGGTRSALSTPPRCGTYATEATFTPWADPGSTFTTTSSFEVTEGPGGTPCPPAGPLPLAPSLEAGTTRSQAGSYSPFVMNLTRGDGQQQITRLDSILPPGVTGKIAGVAQCPEAAISAARSHSGTGELASPSCPAASRIGSLTAGAGVGSALTYVRGSLYLAGPYEASPLSIVAITPAVAGPFDLGTVVIREGLDLNPLSAEVEVKGSATETIPTFLHGIPLQLRDLRVAIDRDQFTLNATGCDPRTVKATLTGSEGASASVGAPYQASGCAALAFKPKLSLSLKGSTKRNGHPTLHSVLRPRAGDANIGRAVVMLPPSEQIDALHVSTPCTRVQFNANQCPPVSVLGTARAYSPLLDQPLEGPVYFRSNGSERELPDVIADLHGQFRIILVGFIDSVHSRLRTTFASVPDAPVSKFELTLKGGKKGFLVNNRSLCGKRKLRTHLAFTAQNGRSYTTNPPIGTSCKKKRPKKKH